MEHFMATNRLKKTMFTSERVYFIFPLNNITYQSSNYFIESSFWMTLIKITERSELWVHLFFRVLVERKVFHRLSHILTWRPWSIISLAHAPVHVTGIPVVNVHVDELSARIWQHELCATLSANVNINYRLPIKGYYRICTLRHIRIEIIHGSQNVFWVLTWVGVYW
jgi:hypothetical protein